MKKFSTQANGVTHDVTFVGVDLAKNVFAVHAVNSCGKPCLANVGVGDVEEDFVQTGTGVPIRDWSDETLRQALAQLLALTRQPGMAERCRQAAEDRFSLQGGVRSYSAIYRRLSGQGPA